jgi:hypothetical protein
MSFCDFAENVEDAIDQGCAYAEENDKTPQLLWLSDIPLFQSVKARSSGRNRYLWDDDDSDTELQVTYQSSRVAYRDETGVYGPPVANGVRHQDDTRSRRGYVEETGQLESDDEEWADGGAAPSTTVTQTAVTQTAVTQTALGRASKGLVVEDLPAYFEITSFPCQKEPEQILDTFAQMFDGNDKIVYEVSETDCHIDGRILLKGFEDEEIETRFQINVFWDEPNQTHQVEFKQQGGNRHNFLIFHAQCLVHLDNNFVDFIDNPEKSEVLSTDASKIVA